MKVMIVEDEPITRMLISKSLEQWGYEVIICEDAEQAVSLLDKNKEVYIVLTDWSLPKMSGLALAEQLKRTHERFIYIIMLTNKSTEENLVEAMENGIDDYITKPFSPAELRARLRAGQRIAEQTLKLKFLANNDELTGIWNRRMLMGQMQNEWQRHTRESVQCCVIMLDIDDFKIINDTYGHAAGDITLRLFANAVKETIRPYDLFGRFGGEEFVLMLPKTDIEIGKKIAERVRKEVSNIQVTLNDETNFKVTVSVGIAEKQDTHLTVQTLIDRADDAMYLAKNNGKNKVAVWQYKKNEKEL